MTHRVSSKPSCLVTGAEIFGLTVAALLAKRGLFVQGIEQADMPGGTCSAFGC
jgi:phytoene dehydrogenase-like protein